MNYEKKINTIRLTRGIANKGFSGMRRFVARFKVYCNLIENRPHSLTGHTATVIAHFRMTTETKINKPIFLTISILTIILYGLLTIMNLGEFYLIGILNKTDGYLFGGEGPTPYYYKTAGLYSTINLIWGLIFLTTLLVAIWTIIKGKRKSVIWFLGLTFLLILGQFLHGQIGTN